MPFFKNLLYNYNAWITNFVTLVGDDEDIVVSKKIWLTLVLFSTFAIGPFTIYYFLAGLYIWTIGGIIFTAYHLLVLLMFIFFRRWIYTFILLNQFFYIFFSFWMVLVSGGILNSGGTVLIGLIGGPVVSLIFPMQKRSYLILILFLITLILEYVFQPYLVPDPTLPHQTNLLFFLFHLIVVSISLFLILRYFINQSRKNQEAEKNLLRKILPVSVVREIMETGRASSKKYEETSIMFADFIEFTNIVASIPAQKLVDELNDIFHHFDEIIDDHELEKIKTIGDGYLAACGLPKQSPLHAIMSVRAAREMIHYIDSRNQNQAIKWKIRIGIHSGPVSAGVVGKNKFSFDIFGDTVNIASRIETAGEEGKINVSAYTYDLIKDEFQGEYRGKIDLKGKGKLDLYFIHP